MFLCSVRRDRRGNGPSQLGVQGESSGRSVCLTAYLCSLLRFKNDGSVVSLTSTFRNVMVGCGVPVGRRECSLGNVCRMNEK